jgi:hypothetical protein
MKPMGVRSHSKKSWQIIHRCLTCGTEKVNRAAPDDMDVIIDMIKSEGFA